MDQLLQGSCVKNQVFRKISLNDYFCGENIPYNYTVHNFKDKVFNDIFLSRLTENTSHDLLKSNYSQKIGKNRY